MYVNIMNINKYTHKYTLGCMGDLNYICKKKINEMTERNLN